MVISLKIYLQFSVKEGQRFSYEIEFVLVYVTFLLPISLTGVLLQQSKDS